MPGRPGVQGQPHKEADCQSPSLCYDLGFRQGHRYGEARHPGPDSEHGLFTISTPNPSGLRSKESLVADWGPGIHNFSETQLSVITQPSVARQLRFCAKQQGRQLRVHVGAPAPIRSGSRWAGTWTGVLVASDFPGRTVTTNWPNDILESGRLLPTYHDVHGVPLTGVVVYGYPSGTTFPKARAATDDLLAHVTRDIVLGRQGPRYVAGDFNHSAESLEELALWKASGWVEAQSLASARWGQEILPTCKGATQRDFVFLSPELAALCKAVAVQDHFADHSSIFVSCEAPWGRSQIKAWPMPSEIPWNSIDVEAWHQSTLDVPVREPDPTQHLRAIAKCMEDSLDGHVKEMPGLRLPTACKGRAQQIRPVMQQAAASMARVSRNGEVTLRSDLVGREVSAWFKQLRRLQSMCHALRADNQHVDAQVYRAELWHKISMCCSFSGGFRSWWLGRRIQLQGSPVMLPLAVPTLEVCDRIFSDFQSNFRSFESWHNRNRGRILESRYQTGRNQLFSELRRQQQDSVDTMQCERSYTILEVDSGSNQVALECPADPRGHSTWELEGALCEVHSFEGPVCRIECTAGVVAGQELQQHQILTRADHTQDEFRKHWEPRWNRHAEVPEEAWERVVGFCTAFLPRRSLVLEPITPQCWFSAVRKYKARAARGADGIAKLDLLSMHPQLISELLYLLNRIETGVSEWPAQMLIGLIMALDKANHKPGPDAFRPICVLSIVYRTYASVRAKQMLRQISAWIDAGAMGFLPHRETKGIWMAVQAAIEMAALQGSDISGFGADIVKANNGLPRRPVLHAAECVGVPQPLVQAWSSFLQGLRRHFVIRHELDEGITSHTGFPEGDPLSTLAMVLVDQCWHVYMGQFAPRCIPLSFVDNLTCMATDVATTAQALVQTQCFAELWDLELDRDKTFSWALQPASKKALQALHLKVVDAAKDLGGFMSYGKRVRVNLHEEMCKAMAPVWRKLRLSKAPIAQKIAALPAKYWSSLLHGAAGCVLSESRLSSLRATATKAIGISTAGSSSALRLVLAPDMTSDPGFFQFWHLLNDFRRLCRKLPFLIDQWEHFMANFEGKLYPGPFSSLVQLCSKVGWSVQPPLIFTGAELGFDLFRAPKDLVRYLAEQAWADMVARQHTHRKTMGDLQGTDLALARLDSKRLTAQENARVQAVQSGANISNQQHSRYDTTKAPLCSICGEPDTVEHKIRFCSRFEQRRSGAEKTLSQWDHWPACLTHHLLAPAYVACRRLMVKLNELPPQMPTMTHDFGFSVWHDLFTDGTCAMEGVFALAA